MASKKKKRKKHIRINDVDVRRTQILDVALDLSQQVGFEIVSRDKIAKVLNCAPGTVSHHFGTMLEFRRALMLHAIDKKNLAVLAQGLAAKNEHAQKAPAGLKKRALASLAA